MSTTSSQERFAPATWIVQTPAPPRFGGRALGGGAVTAASSRQVEEHFGSTRARKLDRIGPSVRELSSRGLPPDRRLPSLDAGVKPVGTLVPRRGREAPRRCTCRQCAGGSDPASPASDSEPRCGGGGARNASGSAASQRNRPLFGLAGARAFFPLPLHFLSVLPSERLTPADSLPATLLRLHGRNTDRFPGVRRGRGASLRPVQITGSRDPPPCLLLRSLLLARRESRPFSAGRGIYVELYLAYPIYTDDHIAVYSMYTHDVHIFNYTQILCVCVYVCVFSS